MFESTEEKCPNTLSGKHDSVENARKTHFICEQCRRILGTTPKESQEKT